MGLSRVKTSQFLSVDLSQSRFISMRVKIVHFREKGILAQKSSILCNMRQIALDRDYHVKKSETDTTASVQETNQIHKI